MAVSKKEKAPAKITGSLASISLPGGDKANGEVASAGARQQAQGRSGGMDPSLLKHNVKDGVCGSRSFTGVDVGGFYKLH